MISVITPSVRPELLPIVARCLNRQTNIEYEWLVCSPKNYNFGVYVPEPPKRDGDYYSLNKAWNALFRQAKGELVVNIVDGLWFEPTLLRRLWDHYQSNPLSCVGAVGDQYDKVVNNKPEHRVWTDPRKTGRNFYEIPPRDFEMCIASVPLKAIKDVGGIDEEYDRYAALAEKEMCRRIASLGYKFYLDETLEYRAIKHPRLNKEWDAHFDAGCELYFKHLGEIERGTRCRIGCL